MAKRKYPDFEKLKVAEALAFLAKHITAKNWYGHGWADDNDTKFCMLNHIEQLNQGMGPELIKATTMALPKPARGISSFNDARGRTVSQVKAVFGRAALMLRKQAGA